MKKVFTIYRVVYVFNHDEQEGFYQLVFVNDYDTEQEAISEVEKLVLQSTHRDGSDFTIMPTYKKL